MPNSSSLELVAEEHAFGCRNLVDHHLQAMQVREFPHLHRIAGKRST